MKMIRRTIVAGLCALALAGCSTPTDTTPATNNPGTGGTNTPGTDNPTPDATLPVNGLLVWYGWEDGYPASATSITNLAKTVANSSVALDGGKVYDIPETGDPTKVGGAHGKYMDNGNGENNNLPPINLPGQAVTVAMWLKVGPTAPQNGFQRLYTTDWIQDGTLFQGFSFFFRQEPDSQVPANGKWELGLGLGAGAHLAGYTDWVDVTQDVAATLTPDLWHQVAVSFNAGTVKFYVDGALVGGQKTAPFSTLGTTQNLWSSFGWCQWAHTLDASGQTYMQKLDEAMIWNRALTDAEVASAYHYIKTLP